MFFLWVCLGLDLLLEDQKSQWLDISHLEHVWRSNITKDYLSHVPNAALYV